MWLGVRTSGTFRDKNSKQVLTQTCKQIASKSFSIANCNSNGPDETGGYTNMAWTMDGVGGHWARFTTLQMRHWFSPIPQDPSF